MERQSPIFQVDSQLVKDVYNKSPNYLIEYKNDKFKEKICVLYFSSHDIYYPNDANAFTRSIIHKDRFEWYNTRIPNAEKHIFLRDVKKQYYLSGINKAINTPDKFLQFLKIETMGYSVFTIGSSAGGFAAVFYGSLLNAKRVYTFNGLFEIKSKLQTTNYEKNPLVFDFSNDKEKLFFYDARNVLRRDTPIYYFHSTKSNKDITQFNYVKDKSINLISFTTSHHGIPFPKQCLSTVLSLKEDDLLSLREKEHNPLLFSIKTIGLYPTIKGVYNQIYNKLISR